MWKSDADNEVGYAGLNNGGLGYLNLETPTQYGLRNCGKFPAWKIKSWLLTGRSSRMPAGTSCNGIRFAPMTYESIFFGRTIMGLQRSSKPGYSQMDGYELDADQILTRSSVIGFANL